MEAKGQTKSLAAELARFERNKELKCEHRIMGHTNSVECVFFNPTDPSKFCSGSHDKSMKLWDVNTQKEIRKV